MVDEFFGFPWSILQKYYKPSSVVQYFTLNFFGQGHEMVIIPHIAIKGLYIYRRPCLQFQKFTNCFRYIFRM